MKYIRTKDEIVNITNANFTRFCEFKIENNTLRTHYYCESFWSEEEIIAQADTIEELCDELVCIRPSFKTPIIETLFDGLIEFINNEDTLLKSIERGYIYYGAIWTDKGLIYVAKMNDKGELELL